MRTVYSTTEVGMPLYAGPDVSADRASTGKWCAPGFEARVVDEHDYEVPQGQIGELLVRSGEPWRMLAGYFGMPEKSAEAWRNGWFHTGDGFVQDTDGHYHFVDRITDSLRRRGENIASMEVEAYVNEHPAWPKPRRSGSPLSTARTKSRSASSSTRATTSRRQNSTLSWPGACRPSWSPAISNTSMILSAPKP